MKLLRQSLIFTLVIVLCTACGGRDSGGGPEAVTSELASAQSLGVDTSAVAGFWDFSSVDPNLPDEQYVELTSNGQWRVYAQFPDDPATSNCYDRQDATFKPIGENLYEASLMSGTVVEIGLVIQNNSLVYTLARPGVGTVSTSVFPAVQGVMPEDLPVCR